MKKLIRYSLPALLAITASFSSAGSPGGLQILWLRSPASAPYDLIVEQRYRAGDMDFGCLYQPLEGLSSEPAIKGIDAQTVFQSRSAKNVRRALSLKLARFRDEDHPHGYDGALAYRVEGGDLVFYGVAAFLGVPVYVAKLPLNALQDEKRVNGALCKALLHIPYNAEP